MEIYPYKLRAMEEAHGALEITFDQLARSPFSMKLDNREINKSPNEPYFGFSSHEKPHGVKRRRIQDGNDCLPSSRLSLGGTARDELDGFLTPPSTRCVEFTTSSSPHPVMRRYSESCLALSSCVSVPSADTFHFMSSYPTQKTPPNEAQNKEEAKIGDQFWGWFVDEHMAIHS